jgi:hypothetical protein
VETLPPIPRHLGILGGESIARRPSGCRRKDTRNFVQAGYTFSIGLVAPKICQGPMISGSTYRHEAFSTSPLAQLP